MCFIQTLAKAYTVSEILAQIDHKNPNETFVLQITFKVIQCHSDDGTRFTPKKLLVHDAVLQYIII